LEDELLEGLQRQFGSFALVALLAALEAHEECVDLRVCGEGFGDGLQSGRVAPCLDRVQVAFWRARAGAFASTWHGEPPYLTPSQSIHPQGKGRERDSI